MLALKSKYKEMSLNGGEPEPLKGYGIQEDPVKVEISGKQKEQDHSAILMEIDKFNKNRVMLKEVERRFTEDMRDEYAMLKTYMKDKLVVNVAEKINKKVHIDHHKLQNQGADYLKRLAQQETEVTKEELISELDYCLTEKSDTNMYLYLKHALPSFYNNYSELVEFDEKGNVVHEAQIQQIDYAAEDRKKRDLKRNWISRKSMRFLGWMQKKKPSPETTDQNVIEVFDVLIQTNRWLQIVDRCNKDVLTHQSYFDKLKALELIDQQSQQDPDQVYDLSEGLREKQYDVRHPGFVQSHCFRFEI